MIFPPIFVIKSQIAAELYAFTLCFLALAYDGLWKNLCAFFARKCHTNVSIIQHPPLLSNDDISDVTPSWEKKGGGRGVNAEAGRGWVGAAGGQPVT